MGYGAVWSSMDELARQARRWIWFGRQGGAGRVLARHGPLGQARRRMEMSGMAQLVLELQAGRSIVGLVMV